MVTFDSDRHIYRDGDRILISVTQLLKKHGLAPDYGDVPDYILEAKAKRGTLIHKEIQDYLEKGDSPMTEEASAAIRWLNERNSMELAVEGMASNDIVAGTFDYLGFVGPNKTMIDWKTTAKFDEEYLSWQLSLYDHLAHTNCAKLVCAQLNGGEITIHEVRKRSRAEIEALLEAERKGEIYKDPSKAMALELAGSGQMAELEEIESFILCHEESIKEAKRREAEIKESILKAMLDNGIKTFESDMLRITVVKETEKGIFDTARFKKEEPGLYKRYSRQTKTKPYIKITAKGDKDAQ